MPSRRRETDGAFRAALSEPTRVLLTLGGAQLTLGEGFGNPRRRLAGQRGEGDRVGYSIWYPNFLQIARIRPPRMTSVLNVPR